MKETKEQLQAIIDGAPDGSATHVDSTGVYYRYTGGIDYDVFMSPDSGDCWRRMPDSCIESPGFIHSLSDIRDKIELMEEKCALETKIAELEGLVENLAEIRAKTVEEILNWEHSYIQTEDGHFAYFHYAIDEYANNIRNGKE